MSKRVLVHVVCWAVLLTEVQLAVIPENKAPNVFTATAHQVSEIFKRELLKALDKPVKREEGESDREPLLRPEVHFSTLRAAETSGSGIPSPTMFVGGFSFMMMPMPEGSEVYNRVMEMAPTFLNMVPGGK